MRNYLLHFYLEFGNIQIFIYGVAFVIRRIRQTFPPFHFTKPTACYVLQITSFLFPNVLSCVLFQRCIISCRGCSSWFVLSTPVRPTFYVHIIYLFLRRLFHFITWFENREKREYSWNFSIAHFELLSLTKDTLNSTSKLPRVMWSQRPSSSIKIKLSTDPGVITR